MTKSKILSLLKRDVEDIQTRLAIVQPHARGTMLAELKEALRLCRHAITAIEIEQYEEVAKSRPRDHRGIPTTGLEQELW